MKLLNRSMQVMVMLLVCSSVFAHIGPKNGNSSNKATDNDAVLNFRMDCQPGVQEIDQQINNVRARLSTGGDVWWNRQEGLYIVPKPAEGDLPVSSIFAGGVWVGGTTRAGSIKLAGVTYRSLTNNYDWYPGPLDLEGQTEAETCDNWDRFFNVKATDVRRVIDLWETDPDFPCDSIPDDVRFWPGKGNPYWRLKYDFELPDQPLGAFWDENGDGIYDPCDGDFPTIQIEKCELTRKKAKELVPDEMHFWIYNDNGGPHRLTVGDAIQMEVQVQAFAYATNDEVNDMTFQRYRLLNKANEDLIDCYFAMWVDPDLGCAFDDLSGCDNDLDASGKPRSLAYTYNEDAVDGDNGPNCGGGTPTYRFSVPMVGTDYFRGPNGPRVFLRDEDTGLPLLDTLGNKILIEPPVGSGLVDTLVELGMTSCIFTFNCGSNPPNPAQCDPEGQDEQFYNNLRGLWRTGEPITFGGTGFNPGSSTDTVRFMFSDPPNDPNGWNMLNVGLSNVDTRTLQATGPLLLQPGVTNELIIGVVWVPDVDYPAPDLARIQSADDVAQALFDNCFDITDGPDAPDMCGIELENEIILTLVNPESSNNFKEEYEEVDLNFNGTVDQDNTYNFEGYLVYQLADAGVTAQELGDISKARLIRQVDVKNDVSEIFNWTSQLAPVGDTRVWSFNREVNGANQGIERTFSVTEDQFALGTDRSLINHKPYYFTVLAYAYNNFEDFNIETELGQRRSYIEGRRNIQTYTFVPRPIVYENLNAGFGDGAIITRISGQGNNGSFLRLADGEAQSIADGSFDGRVTYAEGAGPFTVSIFNPIEVNDGQYRLEFRGEFNDASRVCALEPGATWVLTDLATGEEIASEKTIEEVNEQILYKKGFSIMLSQPDEPGSGVDGNGGIGVSIEYAEGTNPYLSGVGENFDEDTEQVLLNAIIEAFGLGLQPQFDPASVLNWTDSDLAQDPDGDLSTIRSGFLPFYTTNVATVDDANMPLAPYLSPGPRESSLLRLARRAGDINLADLNNVDIVLTPNKDLWSRCIVVETANPNHYDIFGLDTEVGSEQMDVIAKPSLDKNGNQDNSGTEGFSWFPGYAVDVETGQRLNIFFGENTIYNGDLANRLNNPEEGADMIFNPSSQMFADESLHELASIVMGGQHFIYVTRTVYDECEQLASEFSKNTIDFDNMGAITWAGWLMSNNSNPFVSIEDGLVPGEATISLRVNNSFGNERRIEQLNRLGRCDVVEELPVYEFEIRGKESADLVEEEYEGALSNVNIVPNPYYAYSSYENNPFENTIKVTNLPDRAIVTIYTIDGKFIRQFDRDESPRIKAGALSANSQMQTSPALEWDLKNTQGIPVASGVYLFHVVAPELGEERTLKWFGVNRKFDPTGL